VKNSIIKNVFKSFVLDLQQTRLKFFTFKDTRFDTGKLNFSFAIGNSLSSNTLNNQNIGSITTMQD
jgi:hypothetical protein